MHEKIHLLGMSAHNIAINHRAYETGLKTATCFFAGYGGRYITNKFIHMIPENN